MPSRCSHVTDVVSDVIDYDVSDVVAFDVIFTDELTTALPFDNVTDDVSNHVTDFNVTDNAELDVNNVADFDVIITTN